MTRKDYVKFAALFAGELACAKTNGSAVRTVRLIQLRSLVLSAADIFAHDNVRFNRGKFYKACGMDERGNYNEVQN